MPQHRPRQFARQGAVPRRQLLGILLLAASIVAVASSGLWILYDESFEHLDRELGLRLQSVAVTAAAHVPGDSLLVWWLAESTPVEAMLLSQRLGRVELDNKLSRIVVYQSDRTVLLDTARVLERGDVDPFLGLDLAAVEQAAVGIGSYADLQHVDGEYLKAGYAPICDSYEQVVGFVGVIGSAGFFSTLEQLRQRLFAVGFVLLVLVTLLSGIYVGYARKLNRARAALAHGETLAAMGRMAAGIAHEIRNPLGIIKNTAQLLREELEEAGHPTDLVEFIPEEVDRLSETLTGYLEFARDAELRFEDADLCVVLRRTLKLMSAEFENGSVRMTHNLDDVSALSLSMDPRRMQQVFLNLFINAIQAMPDGGELRVEVDNGPSMVMISVQDTGVGLDPAAAEHIFDAFYTSKEKGSGLGLSIVARIVDDHGGSVLMESSLGAGAKMIVKLPRDIRAGSRGS